MEIKFKETKPYLKEIEVTIEPQTVIQKIEQVTSSYAQKAQIPGFRKGMAPRPILQKRYGATFEAMAIDELIEESYKEIIEKHSLEPISQAKVNDYQISDDKTLKFDLSFEVIPDFELKNYLGIKIKKLEPTGFDEEFDKRIKALQERCATFSTLNRPAQNGDYVLVDYDIYENEQSVSKKQTGVMIEVGGEKNMPEINQALLNGQAGEQKSATITFPADYPEKTLANRTLTYKFYIRDVKEKKLPEIDDNFAIDLGFKDLSELRNQINEEILQDRAQIINEDMKNQIYKYLIREHDFEVPPSYVEQTYQELLNEFNIQDDTKAKEKLYPFAIERAKFNIIINRIARKEGIMPTEKDIEQELQKYLNAGLKQDQLEMLSKSPVFLGRLIQNKTLDWLIERADISN
ncbi:MAG: trigger factor [candidate division WOR-3 bacterium]